MHVSLTPEQQENCKAALAILEAAPAERIELSRFKQSVTFPVCGTFFCAMGELCESPHFQALGWFWDEDYFPAVRGEHGQTLDTDQTSEIFFGEGSFDSLFKSRGHSAIDYRMRLMNNDLFRALTDKDLAVLRMRLWLECDGNLNNLNLKDF